jgi:PAS domain S-box-containing protein
MFEVISLYKGLGFVLVTSLALFAVLSAELRKRDRLEKALEDDFTQRQRTEEALHENEQRLQLAIEAANIGLWDRDLRTNQVYYSPQFKGQLGYKDSDFESRVEEWESRIHPDDRDRVLAMDRAYIENPFPGYEVEYRLRHRDGSYRWISSRAALLTDEQGKPYRMLGLHLDVTARKQAEQALRDSEEKFRILMNSAPEAIILADNDGRILLTNTQAEKTFGYTGDEMVGQPIEILIPARFREVHTAHRGSFTALPHAHRMRTGRELIGLHKNGSDIPVEVGLSGVKTGDGTLVAAFIADITERKRVEQQLVYQALLLANASDAIMSTDFDFNIISWNDAAEGIYGWRADEVFQQSIDLLKTETPGSSREEMVQHFRQHGQWKGEVIQYRKDGTRVDILSSVSVVTDEQGKQIGVVAVNRDITEQKRMERELLDAERLRIEIEKERELIQLKERFISVVSHEFRTPLSVIMSSADLVQRYRERMTVEKQHSHIQEILSQSGFMVGLLNDVLTVNKARAGRIEFKPAPVDLKTFCQGIVERLQPAEQEQPQLVLRFEGPLENVVMDAKLLQHILVNLLSNAIKYSPDGGEVRFEVTRQNGDVVFRIRDQGIGIPAKSLARLFEPFHRADNVGSIGGTGLGLAIVKESVDLHRGTISCESEVGVGTTFTVRLPAVS